VEIIPGLHVTMFAETNLAVVSALIREEIAALDVDGPRDASGLRAASSR
jgi:hypothetical protein